MQKTFGVAVSPEADRRLMLEDCALGPPNFDGLRELSTAIRSENAPPGNLRFVILNSGETPIDEDLTVIHPDPPGVIGNTGANPRAVRREDVRVRLEPGRINDISMTSAVARALIAREREMLARDGRYIGAFTGVMGFGVEWVGDLINQDTHGVGCVAATLGWASVLAAPSLASRRFPSTPNQKRLTAINSIARTNPPIPVRGTGSR